MTGKGSAPRPLSVSDEEFGKRFDAIDWSDSRTPQRDAEVTNLLIGLRGQTYVDGDGVNRDMAAIDYAIGVMKATKP